MNAVKFTCKSWFTGRNGMFTSTGIELWPASDDMVVISPITGRHKLGRCDIAIPKADIPEVINLLSSAIISPPSSPKEGSAMACEVERGGSSVPPVPPPMNKFMFGEQACRFYFNFDFETLVQEIENEQLEFSLYEFTGDIADLLQTFSGWGDYAFLTDEEYKTLSELQDEYS